jgi:hypothetical protein
MSAVAYPLAKHGAEAFARMLPFDKLRAGLCLSMTPFSCHASFRIHRIL